MKQDTIFFESEGDKWFKRNLRGLEAFAPETDPITRVLELFQINPSSVLEIGASNGARLAHYVQRFDAQCVAVEPSEAAIADGEKRYPDVTFYRGLAHSLPLQHQVDVVILNYVLSWVSRESINACLQEVNRVLKSSGHLVVGDFFSEKPQHVPYHHLPGEDLFTFKDDYGRYFVEQGQYTLHGFLCGDHDTKAFTTDVTAQNRQAVWLLKKGDP